MWFRNELSSLAELSLYSRTVPWTVTCLLLVSSLPISFSLIILPFNPSWAVGASTVTVTKAGVVQSGFRMPVGTKCPYRLWCLHRLRFNGCRGSLPGVKQPEVKATHERPSEEGLGGPFIAFMFCTGSALITLWPSVCKLRMADSCVNST